MFNETELYIIKASLEMILKDEEPKTGSVWDIEEKMKELGYEVKRPEFIRSFNKLKWKRYLEEFAYGKKKVIYFYVPNLEKEEVAEAIKQLGYQPEEIESFINSYVEKRSSVKK